MKNVQKLIITLSIAIIALIVYFGFQQHFLAQVIVTVAGTILALSMVIEMVETIRNGSYGVDLLAITAIIATLLTGEYWAALIIIVMLVGGESLEDYAANVAHRELTALLQKSPDVGHVKKNGIVQDIEVNKIKIGSTLIIKPMEVIPIDGKLLSLNAILDESSITGESRLYEISSGAEVVSGAINTESVIEIVTTEEAVNSQIQKIINLVKEVENTPARFVRLADRYAIPFTIVAYIIAAVSYFATGNPVRIAEVLVVASPCPLILAAPIAFVSGMSRSSKNGILIKNGTVIEKFATAKSIFFDKTGTITNGKIIVNRLKPVEGVSVEELLQLSYSIEKSSTHILAKALTSYAEGCKIEILMPTEISEVPGLGISAVIGNQHIKIGRASFVNAPDNCDYGTAFYVSRDNEYIGAVIFSDSIREDASTVITELHQLGIAKVTMLTGDNTGTAQKIAAQVGIDEIYSQLLPDEKLKYIKKEKQRPTVMVGDGVNDAPALALADVGVAMGIGESTVASETADLVLLKNELSAIPKGIKISRDTMRIAKQAVLIGIIICIILMLIAATGLIPATIGALFQEVVDTFSIFYALRALRG